MDEVYLAVRAIYFVWAWVLLMALIYWGLQDLILGRKCGHVQMPPEHYLFATASLAATAVLMFALGEIFLKDVPGGVRVFTPFLFLVPASLAVVQGAFRIKMHRRSIELGLCGKGDHSDDPYGLRRNDEKY